MTGSPKKPPERLGLRLERILAQLSGVETADVPAFLAFAEQRARAVQDFETLRAIRDYRQMQASSPTSTTPPEAG